MPARGIRNNNPGNIDFNATQFERDKWEGELGIEDHPSARFTTFISPEYGIRAMCKILLTYHHKRKANDGSAIDTVQEVIDRWAPPIENDTDAYANAVRSAMGIIKGEEIDIDDPDILTGLTEQIIRHENGEQPYDEATIMRGVCLALGMREV